MRLSLYQDRVSHLHFSPCRPREYGDDFLAFYFLAVHRTKPHHDLYVLLHRKKL